MAATEQRLRHEKTAADANCRAAGNSLRAQGRSFGIQVLLASQTLAGSYSLPRTTVDQMGVCIALQCSDTDSRLILSDDNPAARFSNDRARRFTTAPMDALRATISSELDTPAAARLGQDRACLYSEDEGRLEKFCPYGLPSAEWLATLGKQS